VSVWLYVYTHTYFINVYTPSHITHTHTHPKCIHTNTRADAALRQRVLSRLPLLLLQSAEVKHEADGDVRGRTSHTSQRPWITEDMNIEPTHQAHTPKKILGSAVQFKTTIAPPLSPFLPPPSTAAMQVGSLTAERRQKFTGWRTERVATVTPAIGFFLAQNSNAQCRPFDMACKQEKVEVVDIAARNMIKTCVNVKVGDMLNWTFAVKDLDVKFNVKLRKTAESGGKVRVVGVIEEEQLVKAAKVDANSLAEGTWTCKEAGQVEVCWDNSYSILRSKTIAYRTWIVKSHESSQPPQVQNSLAEDAWTTSVEEAPESDVPAQRKQEAKAAAAAKDAEAKRKEEKERTSSSVSSMSTFSAYSETVRNDRLLSRDDNRQRQAALTQRQAVPSTPRTAVPGAMSRVVEWLVPVQAVQHIPSPAPPPGPPPPNALVFLHHFACFLAA